MSKSNYELQLNGLGYNADGTPMIKTTTVRKTPTYDDLEERVDAFERKLIDEYGIPIGEAEKLITDDLLGIVEMAIDAKFADFFNPSVETPGVEKGEF